MMTPLPGPLPGLLLGPSADAAALVAWRVDQALLATSWDSGLGAELAGGRWSPVGLKAVYCALDPATSIIEVAVHKKFKVLDTQPHVLTSLHVLDMANLHVVYPDDVPNPAWLHGGIPSAGQQNFGAELLHTHDFVLFPSAVSKKSWNMVFHPLKTAGKYSLRSQDRLVVDARLNPPP
jgi:RES domain-containing protein